MISHTNLEALRDRLIQIRRRRNAAADLIATLAQGNRLELTTELVADVASYDAQIVALEAAIDSVKAPE